jgi:hypothetical protein
LLPDLGVQGRGFTGPWERGRRGEIGSDEGREFGQEDGGINLGQEG